MTKYYKVEDLSGYGLADSSEWFSKDYEELVFRLASCRLYVMEMGNELDDDFRQTDFKTYDDYFDHYYGNYETDIEVALRIVSQQNFKVVEISKEEYEFNSNPFLKKEEG